MTRVSSQNGGKTSFLPSKVDKERSFHHFMSTAATEKSLQNNGV